MFIHYGFDIKIRLAGPTTMVTLLDVRPELRRGVVAESGLHTDPRLENSPSSMRTATRADVSRRPQARSG